jgi:peptidylprolyl isomerase
LPIDISPREFPQKARLQSISREMTIPLFLQQQILKSKEQGMTLAKNGDTVTVHYTGTLADGSIFDSTAGEEPMVFTLGDGELIEGFEEAILNMSVGEKKTVTLAPEKAYGERDEEMVIEVPRTEMPADLDLEVGDELEVTDEDDEPMLVTVSQLSEETVTLDGNPPLAGETLTFEIELVAIG